MIKRFVVALAISMLAGLPHAAHATDPLPAPALSTAAEADVPDQLVGTWVREKSDANTYQKITLTLRGDGTYTKALEARVNGAPYGGTHDGTWSARGSVVYLSGDGNWPRITHDLSEFRKAE